MYEYDATSVRCVDGDTVELRIDLGLSVFVVEKCRLARINAPEKTGPERQQGIGSMVHLDSLVSNRPLRIVTIKDRKGKYGRYLVEINIDGDNINDQMVRDGFAEFKQY